jgi:hypothetical protein
MSDAFRRTMFTVVAACAVITARPVHAGFKAHARSFKCLLEGTKPAGKNFYVFHRNRRKLARAVALAEGGAPGETYPVGTILQLFPFEAMVKRGGRFNPEGHGWEFFKLRVDDHNRTTIVARGGSEVTNLFGSCQGCHMTGEAPQFDLVCEGHGAFRLPLDPATIQENQDSDPRCQKPAEETR